MQKTVEKNQVLEVADRIGDFIEYWGFKRVHGKIWALIFLADRPVNAGYLIDNLQISKSLASMSLKELLDYNVISEAPGKHSTVHYVANEKIAKVITDVLFQREAKMLLEIRSACEMLGRLDASDLNGMASNRRIADMNKMVCYADGFLRSFLALQDISLKKFAMALTFGRTQNRQKEDLQS